MQIWPTEVRLVGQLRSKSVLRVYFSYKTFTGPFVEPKRLMFQLSKRLNQITSLFELSLVLDQSLAQLKAKSKSEVTQCMNIALNNKQFRS